MLGCTVVYEALSLLWILKLISVLLSQAMLQQISYYVPFFTCMSVFPGRETPRGETLLQAYKHLNVAKKPNGRGFSFSSGDWNSLPALCFIHPQTFQCPKSDSRFLLQLFFLPILPQFIRWCHHHLSFQVPKSQVIWYFYLSSIPQDQQFCKNCRFNLQNITRIHSLSSISTIAILVQDTIPSYLVYDNNFLTSLPTSIPPPTTT